MGIINDQLLLDIVMNNIGSPPTKRMRLSGDDLSKISKDEIIQLYIKQQDVLGELQAKTTDFEREPGEKSKIAETSRRENVLVMRLATKEQELQQYAAQMAHIKKSQEDVAAKSLREALLDPAVNLLFDKMIDELKETKNKLEQAQSELSAWKFTPDSQTGKKLMSRCRTLIAENQELGKQLSQGKVAQLEAELALQKKYSEDLKQSQEELNEFVIQLDEEVEGMQSTIQLLQQQLNDARKEAERYKKLAQDVRPDDKTRTTDGDTDSIEMDVKRTENRKDKSERSFVKIEVGENQNDTVKHPKSPQERNNHSLEYNLNDDFDRQNEIGDENTQNGDQMEMDNENMGVKEGESETSTYSEHEIIDESQDSSPDMTPERDSSQNIEGDIESGDKKMDGDLHEGDINPMNDGEMYKVIDNGSDDDTAPLVDTADGSVPCEIDSLPKDPPTPTGEFIENFEHDESLDYEENIEEHEEIQVVEESIVEDAADDDRTKTDTVENGVIKDGDNEDIQEETDHAEDPNAKDETLKQEEAEVTEVQKQETHLQADTTPNRASTVPDEVITKTEAIPTSAEQTSTMMKLPNNKPELQLPPVNGPQAALSTLAHSFMQPAQVPLIGDPTAYLMNPHFQHIPSASAALAQQQAILAEQAMIYKSMLAQQQQHLVATDEKLLQSNDAADPAKAGDEYRKNVTPNPLVPGLPFTDPSTAAFLAQYKAMLAAQSMFVPGRDGKTPQVLAPRGLGLYPGLPLVQPSVLAPQQNSEHGTTNNVSASWPSGTAVSYAHHPLMTQGFLGTNATPGMMMYPNWTSQQVIAHPTVVDLDKHHGSGDHHPVSNGLPSQKNPDNTDTNPAKEEPQIVV